MELVICMKVKTDIHQREALIWLENYMLDTDTVRTIEHIHLRRDPKYKYEYSIYTTNEFGKLAYGVGGRVKVTDTIYFVHKRNVPKDRLKDVTYGKFALLLGKTK